MILTKTNIHAFDFASIVKHSLEMREKYIKEMEEKGYVVKYDGGDEIYFEKKEKENKK